MKTPFMNNLKSFALVILPASFFLLLTSYVFAQSMSSTNYSIPDQSINFAGKLSSSTNYSVEDTAGEVATGFSASANYGISAGYQQMNIVTLSVVPPTNVTLSPALGGVSGGSANGSTTFTVTTDDAAGYTATLTASSSPALVSGSNSFADYSPAGAAPDYTYSVLPTNSNFGFSVQGSDADQRFKNNGSVCNTGSNTTASTCWDGLSTSPKAVAGRTTNNTPSGTQTVLYFRAATGSNHIQVNGTYVATTTLTVTPL
ncbi:MAG TPA: hypothetical protein VL335_00405 [Candidatus Paceibacterota bacterium]|nr:hypothetical protein [Candidatus Paceibacterota bacterium]